MEATQSNSQYQSENPKFEPNEDEEGKPLHHLTRHWLQSHSKGEAAIARLGADDIKSAEKMIRSLGQRELRMAFQRVYEAETNSYNNSWLRRKLYEAVGVPKAATKRPTMSIKRSNIIKKRKTERTKIISAEAEQHAAQALTELLMG